MWLQITFFLLVLAAFAVPNKPIAQHLQSSIASGDFARGEWPGEPVGPTFRDGYTECVALTEGLPRLEKNGLIYRTVADGYLGWCGPAKAALASYDGTQPAMEQYFRYWHGYTVLTRPFLSLAGVQALRIVLWVVLALSLAGFVWSCGRRWWIAAAAITPLLATSDAVVLPVSVPAAISWVVVLLSWALVWRRRASWRLSIVALVAGSLFSFVDLFSNPPAAWVLVIFAAGASAYVASRSTRLVARDMVVAASMWMVGFAGTWGVKWLLGLDAFGVKTFKRAVLEQIGLRLNGGSVDNSLGASVSKNWSDWTPPGISRVLVGLVLACVALALLWAAWRRQIGPALLLAAPAAIVPIWLEILKNHSEVHAWFTYRALPVACGVAIAAAVLAARAGVSSELDLNAGSTPRHSRREIGGP
jgi:hypothetical protein